MLKNKLTPKMVQFAESSHAVHGVSIAQASASTPCTVAMVARSQETEAASLRASAREQQERHKVIKKVSKSQVGEREQGRATNDERQATG